MTKKFLEELFEIKTVPAEEKEWVAMQIPLGGVERMRSFSFRRAEKKSATSIQA